MDGRTGPLDEVWQVPQTSLTSDADNSSVADQTRSDIALLYRRAGFGIRPDELDALTGAGYNAAVDGLLAGLGSAPDPAGDKVAVPTLQNYQRHPKTFTQAERKAADAVYATELRDLQDWWLNRMIKTSTPLREKLTLFWHGHFATGVAKVRDAKLMYLQNQLFRTAGAGPFDQLVQAVAKDGAMMVWLDTATDVKDHPNENFAREMMELFTLGVNSYTQDDVVAGARAFTGWRYDRLAYQYRFVPRLHDYGAKTYLGQTGDWNGEDVVNIAVRNPVSPRFVMAKLWSHFAYPVTPAEPVVTDLVAAYGPSMNLTSALEAMFKHDAFRTATTRANLVKQPIEYLAGAARALGLDATAERTGSSPSHGSGRPLAVIATALGQTPFNPPNVGGWGQNAYWLDTSTALVRQEAALLLALRADLTSIRSIPPSQRPATVARMLSIDGFGPTTMTALAAAQNNPVQLMALALASPEYVLA